MGEDIKKDPVNPDKESCCGAHADHTAEGCCGGHHDHDHAEGGHCGHHDHDHAEGGHCGHHDHAHAEGGHCGHHDHAHAEGGHCGHHHHQHGGNQVMMGRISDHLLGTMTVYTPASLPVAEVNMNLSMKDVALFIQENGGVPMQMKASLKDSQHTVLMNMLGKDIYRSESEESIEESTTKVKCNLLAVADGLDAEKLRGKLEEIMHYFEDNSF